MNEILLDLKTVGEIRKGGEIGYKHKHQKFIWLDCGLCGKQRWVEIRCGKPSYNRCFRCSQLGRKHSEETRAKMRASSRHLSPMLGKHHTKETRNKLSALSRGRKNSLETRLKISQGLYGVYLNGRSSRWGGGRYDNGEGSIRLWMHPDDPYASMIRRGKGIMESRLVMAKFLGRLLKPEERVYHLNGVKDDNRIENLKLFSNSSDLMKFHTKHKHINLAKLRWG